MASHILLTVAILTMSCISLSSCSYDGATTYPARVVNTSQEECPSDAQRETVIDEVKEDIRNTLLQIHSRPPGPTTGGVVYTRWGRTTCSNTSGTQLVYAGQAAGSYHTANGGGVNYLCLPEQPQYSNYTDGAQSARAYLYGAEYETGVTTPGNVGVGPLRSFHDHNVPCAVCHTSTRGSVLMIPAQTTCPSSWTREYYGYLMAERTHPSHARSTFECVDHNPQTVPGTGINTHGALFFHVEVKCNYGIPCPPYDTQKEVTCVVCTK